MNLNRHNTAAGAHHIATTETRDRMANAIRQAIKPHPMREDIVKAIADARLAQVDAEQAATTAEAEKVALVKKHTDSITKLEQLTETPEAIDVDQALAQKLALEKQAARVGIIAARLPDIRTAATEARKAANEAKQAHVSLETQAARDMAQQAMPAPRGPLVDLDAAAAVWALDAAMHPAKQHFPACTFGEFIDSQFTTTETLALVEIARAEISNTIRG